ncbi:MAG: SIS domain-containing protein [Methylococcaceae bacterium]|nr:SIS domain-containing protein [Methylococcaceae bacterium]OYV22509.1 MAG: 6-phospho-3-hexuloisomerase [Methylococcaceae bacterium NSO1]
MWQEENQSLIIDKLSEMLSATDTKYAEKLTAMFDEARRIFISGAGRSKLVGNFLLMHCGYDVAMVGEIVTPSIKSGDLLVVISGSGETDQLIAFTKKAKEIGAKVVLISSRANSTIGDLAEAVFQIGKQELYQKVKGMPMGTVFELSTLCFLEALISHIVWEKAIPEEKMKERHANLE